MKKTLVYSGYKTRTLVKVFASTMFLISATAMAGDKDMSWIEQYSACYHAVENLPYHIRQTKPVPEPFFAGEASRAEAAQINRYKNTEHILGERAGKKGLFLLPGDTAIFVPLTESLAKEEDLFPNDKNLKGAFAQDKYDVELVERGKPTIYLTIRLSKDKGVSKKDQVSVVEFSLHKDSSIKYRTVEASDSFDERLRDQFRKQLVDRISRVTDDQARQSNEFASFNAHADQMEELEIGIDGELLIHKAHRAIPTDPKKFRNALERCQSLFANADEQDKKLKNVIVAELTKFNKANAPIDFGVGTDDTKPAEAAPAK